MRAVRTHYGQAQIHQAYRLRHQRDGTAGTMRLCHLCNYHQTSVMTTCWMELLEFGHRRGYRRGSRSGAGLFGDYCEQDGAAGGRGWSDTAASVLYDYAASQERADASVRCTGLGEDCLLQQPRHGPGIYHLMCQ